MDATLGTVLVLGLGYRSGQAPPVRASYRKEIGMAAEEKTAGRGGIATVVATAAVTLAIGVTAAGLGGYLTPARDHARATAAQPSEPRVVETRPATQTGASSVVLVPVAPDAAPNSPVPEPLLVASEPTEHDEEGGHHRGRNHHEREHHEDDHDDDD